MGTNTSPQALLQALPPAERAALQQLTRAPKYSWPTLFLWVLVMGVYLSSYALGGLGLIPLWVGMVANSLIGYLAFSVVHDSIHRSISTHTGFNDFVGQSTAWIGSPYVNLKLFRWGHILHHRFTSSLRDPDWVLHGPWWSLPFRWMLIDVFYLIHALRSGDKVSKPYLSTSLWLTLATVLVFAALIYTGYGLHLLMLWFIPSRLILFSLGFSFFWLPHVPHEVSQEENFTRATSVRLGHEWLLGPLLQCQNYHLIHHLFPSTPFYNNEAVWKILEPVLRRHDLAIQEGFNIRPTFHEARP